jgi:hypothetical protein
MKILHNPQVLLIHTIDLFNKSRIPLEDLLPYVILVSLTPHTFVWQPCCYY